MCAHRAGRRFSGRHPKAALCEIPARWRYNKTFESSRLDDLARWLPPYKSEIKAIKAKMWDLLLAVRRNVYHPTFAGSFSLKTALPAFAPPS
jgi:hypothetical protein